MKLLAFADLHGDENIIDRLRILTMRTSYDAALIAGDITDRGPVGYAQELIELFGDNAYYIHGNNDTQPVQDVLKATGKFVHGQKVKFGTWNIVGWGGSNKTPFGTPCEYSEEEIEAGLEKAGVDAYSILMTHAPPYGFFDNVGEGVHIGSIALRKIIERHSPLINICGHVHETSGSMLYKETMIIKVPDARKMLALEINIADTIQVNTIRL